IQMGLLSYRLQRWQLTKVFGVKRKLEINIPDKKANWEFSFELHLEHCGMQKTNHLIKISRKSFKINGKEPDYLMARLAHELQKGLYPIIFVADAFGRLVDIFNFEEIKKNWNVKKAEIQQLNEGAGLDNLIAQFETYLENKELFFERIKYDFSISGLFLPVYRNYGITHKIEQEKFDVHLSGIEKVSFAGEIHYEKMNDLHNSKFLG